MQGLEWVGEEFAALVQERRGQQVRGSQRQREPGAREAWSHFVPGVLRATRVWSGSSVWIFFRLYIEGRGDIHSAWLLCGLNVIRTEKCLAWAWP